MKHDYLLDVFGSPTKIQLLQSLMKAKEDGVPVTSLTRTTHGTQKKIRSELRLLKKKKIVVSAGTRDREVWMVNKSHAHYASLLQFMNSVSPTQHHDVATVLKKAGKVSLVILSGAFTGDTTRPVDMVLAGDAVNEHKLEKTVTKLEEEWGHEIRYAVFPPEEIRYRLTVQDRLLREVLDFPHQVLLDSKRLLA
ncbi:hypothetical protein EBR66_00270 [bacterium]|nr:hypothetical protein [bacterium]